MSHPIARPTHSKRWRVWSVLPGVLLFFLFGLNMVYAQSSVVSGHVTDSSGAAVSKAAIAIQNGATGVVTNALSNADGYYQMPPLVPGSYVLRVKSPSFADAMVTEIRLEAGGSRTIDVALQPSETAQSVTVEASAPELVVDKPDRGNVIESKFVQNIPLNIRNPLQMVNFAQGVTPYTSESGNNDQSQAYTNTFRINGGKLATTESLLDGAANTTTYDYNAVAAVPQVDSIQEFRVLTTAYAPEWGRTSGGVVTFATKSGTNQLHGSVFEYIRNSLLDANGFNADAAHLAKPHFQRNQFGYSLGGPVILPRLYHGQDRTFFFSTYEGLRQSQAGSFTGTVPTGLEQQGDFSQTRDANGNLIVIYDPGQRRWTRRIQATTFAHRFSTIRFRASI